MELIQYIRSLKRIYMLIAPSHVKNELSENGFATMPFPQELRALMLQHIDAYLRELAAPYSREKSQDASSLEKIVFPIPDADWAVKMNRAFRIFPRNVSEKIVQWSDQVLRTELGKKRSAVNLVYPQEANLNPKIKKDHYAIYWRCVRPGKPDAGRPHRDASFWVLEFE